MYQLSVIIPVYNASAWLDHCMGSILTALRGSPDAAEILLINDGSTDGSGALCNRYAAEYANIHVLHKENGGVASARNLGLKHAAGQYIAWVDPDDYVSGNWYSRIAAAIEAGKPDVIVMDSVRFGDGPDKPEIYGRPGGFVDRDLFVEDVIRDIRMLSGMPNKVMKAELFKDVQFDTSLPILEDYAAIPKILASAKTVYYLRECLYYYRQYSGSLLHQTSPERAFRSVEIALEREKNVEPKFRQAAVTAVALQAFLFCWHRYTDKDFCASKDQMCFCKRYIRSHLPVLLRDREISRGMKMKMVILSMELYGVFIYLRGRRK